MCRKKHAGVKTDVFGQGVLNTMPYNKEADTARLLREHEKRMNEYYDAKEKQQQRLAAKAANKPVLTAAEQEAKERQRKEAVERAKQENRQRIKQQF